MSHVERPGNLAASRRMVRALATPGAARDAQATASALVANVRTTGPTAPSNQHDGVVP